MAAIGAAVVGIGFIGPVHVEALRRLGHRVVGLLGSSAEKSFLAARDLGIPRGYADLVELLDDPLVQVIHLASPNVHHYEQCKRVLNAGKHVVCEKPLAMTSAETAELVALARKRGVVAAVNYNVRFYPLVLEARARRRAGHLGRVFHITGDYLQDWLLLPGDYNWRVSAGEGGALRAVADIGTHWLDTVCFISGLEVEAVFADLKTVHPERLKPLGGSETFRGPKSVSAKIERIRVTTEDHASILLRFKGGARGSFTVSQVAAGRKNALRFDIAGESCSFGWNSEEPNGLQIGYRDRPNKLLTRDPSLLAPGVRPYANYPGGHAEGFPDTFKQLYRAIYADVERALTGQPRDPEPLYASFADGHREVQLCEAILLSHATERWVGV